MLRLDPNTQVRGMKAPAGLVQASTASSTYSWSECCPRLGSAGSLAHHPMS